MALGSIALPDTNVGFDAQGTAVMPVTAGTETVGTIKLKSPFEMFKETFTSMKESLLNMVNLQSQEQKDADFVGPGVREGKEALEGVDTDDNKYGNFVEKAQTKGTEILEGIREAFDKVSFGEKMMALVLTGGFFIFSKYKDKLTKVLTPIVQFVMDAVKFLGPTGAFATFLGGFILLKSGLAKKGIMKAGGLILKTIKASAAAIDKQGGILKAMGNGFEKINRGAKSLVGQLGKIGGKITGGLTKGFAMLGKGFTALRLGVMSMYSSIMPMIAPFLPIIAIAAAVVAVFFALKSGFETFKQSLEDGDSMFTAVLKGLGDAMLTLVTLPYVLIQKLVGFVAGLFGFDNFKEKLESFDIKEQIVNALGSLVGGLVRVLKGVAKGAGAALAAVFSFSNPVEAFSKAYAAVMAGGEAESAALQGTSDFQGDESQKDFNDDSAKRDKVKGYNNMDTSEMGGDLIGGDEGQGTGNATAVSFYAKQAEEQRYRDLGTGPRANLSFEDEMRMKGVTMGATGSDDFGGAVYDENGKKIDYLAEMMANTTFESKQVTTRTLKENGKITSQSGSTIVIKGGDKQGDTITNASTTQVTGELSVNHNEMTQKILSEHF